MIGKPIRRAPLHCVITLTAVLSCTSVRAATEAPAESALPERFDVAELQQDFEALYQGLQASHFDLYARRDKADYDRRYEQVREAIDEPMSLQAAEVHFQRFVAYGDIAHARIDFPAAAWEAFRQGGGTALPIYPQFVAGQFHVGESYVDEVPVGAQLTALQGLPIADWTARLRQHLSADSDYLAQTMLEFRWPALLWLELGEQPDYSIAWTAADGSQQHRHIPALSQAQLRSAAAARAGADRPERALELRPDGIAYLRPGPFYNIDPGAADPWDPGSFVAFVDAAFEQILAADARALLIDLRDNPGGDSSFSDPLVAWFADEPFRFCSRFTVRSSVAARQSNLERMRLAGDRVSPVASLYESLYAANPPGSLFEVDFPAAEPRQGDRFEGPVYLLINRHSYSNTVTVAALAQDYGFARILGEETADLASTYGAMEQFTLPHTGIQVGFPKAHIIRPNGDDGARGVVPDVAIQTPLGPDSWDRVLSQAAGIVKAELAAGDVASAAESP